MTGAEALDALAELYGIHPSFVDLGGVTHETSPDTKRALLRANGLDVASETQIVETLAAETARRSSRRYPEEIIVESGSPTSLDFGGGAEWSVTEDGTETVVAEGRGSGTIALPALPSGVYDLAVRDAARVEHVTLLAAPCRLPSVEDLTGCNRLWGLSAALYGLTSERNAGMGDFFDLETAASAFGGLGAGFVGLNPVHAMGYCDVETASPYSPSHRGFLNTSYIALDHVPGLGGKPAVAELLDSHGVELERLRASDTVLHAAHKRAHRKMLEMLYDIFGREAGSRAAESFDAYAEAATPATLRFVAYEALSERHGADWRTWPRDVSAEDAPEDRARFHLWLQWVAERQLQRAQTRALDSGMPLGLYLDLAVGPRRDGAEAWCEQDTVAIGVSVGAPPDHLNPEGQRWNLAAFSPARLRAQRYAPLRGILTATMRDAGVVRIDHVLGLFRSFWLPDDGSPGAYISQPFESLLAIIKIEAERNGTAVIGEDLGLVPEGFRETMRGHGFYGYSVLQYEKTDAGHIRDPKSGPAQVLSCFATHDTPTLRGFRQGRDIDWWEGLGWTDAETAQAARVQRRTDVAALVALGDESDCGVPSPEDDGDRLQNAVHGALAGSPAAMVCVQLDDVLGSTEAQNLPGTVEEHPNWQRRHDLPVEDLATHDGLASLAACMQRAGRSATPFSTEDDDNDP
ncbi:4-alpha-glucanotransferase [Sulfitobacter sp. D35]|uniref:4-alpha-glucanotransferase n=1 Tax=Sulfitobacter sp. D35 TaxID=3083252 RepID=UPI00296F9C5E|nr:4-alpha-glucanotransferase [Sulfitobacter sp. D35]MDW4498951.1 4-alpha-glucanotransferase [Sulfitobacter sp. D35]